MKIKALLALLLFCTALPALAQTKPAVPSQSPQPGDDEDVVRITTNLVQVDAVVTKAGKPVTNLTADDFEIYQDGRRQTITTFAYISNVPNKTAQPASTKMDGSPAVPLKPNEPRRTIAFVVDDLGLSAESMGQVRKQLRKVIAEQLEPNDAVAIIRTGGEMGVLQQFTNDKRLLNRAVDALRWNFCSRMGLTVFRPFGSLDNLTYCGARSLYSTIRALRFIVDSMGYLPGRKSLVLMSDHLPRESQDEYLDTRGFMRAAGAVKGSSPASEGQGAPKPEGANADSSPSPLDKSVTSFEALLDRLAEKAMRASVVIYSIDTQGLQYTGLTAADVFRGGGRELQELMSSRSMALVIRREGGELIAKQTGGFQIRNSNFFELNRVLETESGYYLLGYRPLEETFNKRFHHIKAKVKRSGLTVRTRYGFVGVTEDEASQARLSGQDLTNLALASPFGAQDIEVDLTPFFADEKSTGPVVRAFVYLGAKDLSFAAVNGKYHASLVLHGVIFGDNGKVGGAFKRGLTMSLSDVEYEQAMNNGIGLSFDIPAKRPGAYQVRVAARDRNSQKIGSAARFLTVPSLKNNTLAVSGLVLGGVDEFSSQAADAGDQAVTKPGSRRFAANSDLYFAYAIYNAANESGKLRNLVGEAKLFRDGKNVYSSPSAPINAGSQTDLNRLFANGVIRLAPDLEPGGYYLQVVITDKDAKKGQAPLVQWVDFEIEKR